MITRLDDVCEAFRIVEKLQEWLDSVYAQCSTDDIPYASADIGVYYITIDIGSTTIWSSEAGNTRPTLDCCKLSWLEFVKQQALCLSENEQH